MITVLICMIVIGLLGAIILTWIPPNPPESTTSATIRVPRTDFPSRIYGKDVYIRGVYEGRYADYLTKKHRFASKRGRKEQKG